MATPGKVAVANEGVPSAAKAGHVVNGICTG
jgi:hypothetical protein